MKKLIDDRGRAERLARRRRGPEGSILDGCDPRTGAGNEARRDGSAARASNFFMDGSLGTSRSERCQAGFITCCE